MRKNILRQNIVVDINTIVIENCGQLVDVLVLPNIFLLEQGVDVEWIMDRRYLIRLDGRLLIIGSTADVASLWLVFQLLIFLLFDIELGCFLALVDRLSNADYL